MSAFVAFQFSFFSTMPREWLGRTSPKWPILWRVGRTPCLKKRPTIGLL